MYYLKVDDTVQRDELIAGTENLRLENVSITSGIFEPASAAADKNKVLVIAAENYSDTGSEVGVTSVYTSGNFHTEKLSTGSSVVSAADFKEPLRQVQILQTSLKEVF